MSKSVTLTEAQAKVVQQSLDAAIRAGGANAAVVILPIMQEIETQITGQAGSPAVASIITPHHINNESQIAKQPTQEETT